MLSVFVIKVENVKNKMQPGFIYRYENFNEYFQLWVNINYHD